MAIEPTDVDVEDSELYAEGEPEAEDEAVAATAAEDATAPQTGSGGP